MKIVTFPFVLICIAVILSSPFALASITVDDAKIKSYLEAWLVEEQGYIGHPVVADKDKDSFLTEYTAGTSLLSSGGTTTLTDVAKLHISFMEGSATMTFMDTCDMADKLWTDKATQEAIYQHFKKLDEAGKKYCNMFLYLTCKEDTTVMPAVHKCQCPSGMLWEGGKCVINSGGLCSGFTDAFTGQTFVDGHSYAIFNFITKEYNSNIPHPTCAGMDHCADYVCVPDLYYAYHSTPTAIAAFLKKHADADTQYENDPDYRTELVRQTMVDITRKYRGFAVLALSMELQTESLLQDHGKTCDYNLDSTLAKSMNMTTYNSRESSSDFGNIELGKDMMRIRFQMGVIDAGSTPVICNHFKLFQCTKNGLCDCSETAVWDAATASCTTKEDQQCSSDSSGWADVKLFKLSSKPSVSISSIQNPGHSSPLTFSIKYFDSTTLKCMTGTLCERLDLTTLTQWTCMKPGGIMGLMTLRGDFDKKFSITLGGACDANHQTALFMKPTSNSFVDIRKKIEDVVKDAAATYCRLMEYATCSTGTGTCVCVYPTIASAAGTCSVSQTYRDCGLLKSDVHQALDNLILPIVVAGTEYVDNNIFCPPNFLCLDDPVLIKRICTCEPSSPRFGEKCTIEPHYHVDHLDVEYLPDSMRTTEGRKLISDLHEALTNLAGTETIKFGNLCTEQDDQDWNPIQSFFGKIRDDCNCYLHSAGVTPWKCDAACKTNKPEFEIVKFEGVLKDVNALVGQGHPICERTKNVRCVSGMCQCPEDFFLEKGECRAELGTEGPCSVSRRNVPYSGVHCRDGAMCSSYKRRCESDNPVITRDAKIRWSDKETTRSYITNVKAALKKYLMSHKNSLRHLRVLKDDHACNYKMELMFETIVVELDPLLDSLKDGDISQDRGDIRRMEPVASRIRAAANQPKAKFCRVKLHCSPETNTCTRGDKPHTPDKTSSSARDLLNQGLIAILLIFFYVFGF